MSEIEKLAASLNDAGVQYILKPRMSASKANIDWGWQVVVYDAKGKRLWDAICGYGSYGGDKGLLEIMGTIVDEEQDYDSVVGWLTADDVMERHYEVHGRSV